MAVVYTRNQEPFSLSSCEFNVDCALKFESAQALERLQAPPEESSLEDLPEWIGGLDPLHLSGGVVRTPPDPHEHEDCGSTLQTRG